MRILWILVLPLACVWGCGKTTHLPGVPPVAPEKQASREGETASGSRELTIETARQLIPQAAAMSRQEYLDILNQPPVRVGEIANQSLTAVLLAVDPFHASRQSARAEAGFRYLTPDEELDPIRLRAAVEGRDDAELVSLIPPDSITSCTCSNQGEIATGRVDYRVENLYEGSADFTARRQGDEWRIIVFQVPEYRLITKRQADGRWQLVSEEQLLGVAWP